MKITERLLHFIWQYQYYNQTCLTTSKGEPVQVIYPGQYNRDQGPDFSNAKIKIAGTTWAGTVELHINSSDWKKHGHDADANYRTVILHVVWEDDKTASTANEIPVLVLGGRVPAILLQRYNSLMLSDSFIACQHSISGIRDISWNSWKDRVLVERILRKAKAVEQYLQQNNYHWEETFWWLLARNFGIKVNADAFEEMARSIPLTVLAKNKSQIHQLEALLFGQAGLLKGSFDEDYPILLQSEYKFLQRKYNIQPIATPLHFLRMRPGNFPTIRLAQLAMLIYGSSHLFSKIKDAASLEEIKNWLNCIANDYWHYHYRFDEAAAYRQKNLGKSMVDNIIINTVVPVLFAYGHYHQEQQYKDKALQWLEQLEAENNHIIRGFGKLGIKCKSAYDSQGLIELKTQYCDSKRCLDCGVGNYLLKQTK